METLEPTGNAVQIVAEIPVHVCLELRSVNSLGKYELSYALAVFWLDSINKQIFTKKGCRWIEN